MRLEAARDHHGSAASDTDSQHDSRLPNSSHPVCAAKLCYSLSCAWTEDHGFAACACCSPRGSYAHRVCMSQRPSGSTTIPPFALDFHWEFCRLCASFLDRRTDPF